MVASDAIRVRPGEAEDMAVVHRMVKELADYEKEPDAVETDVSTLVQDGFGGSRMFSTFIAEVEEGGKYDPVGFVLWFYCYSTWQGACLYVEDLYVRPSYRRQGVGRKLLAACAGVAQKQKCARMMWQVLDWNENAIRMYDQIGAQQLREWRSMRLERDGIARLASADVVEAQCAEPPK